MNLADKLLLIHLDAVTHNAPRRRIKHKGGHMLTAALFTAAVVLIVFGRGML